MLKRTICFAIAFGVLFAACSGGSSGPADNGAAGTYHLISINGLAVPVTVSLTATKKVEITSSILILDPSRTFSNTTSYRTTESGQVTNTSEKCSGTFFYFGASIAFTETTAQNTTCGSQYTGVWDNASQIIVDFDPTTHAVFVK